MDIARFPSTFAILPKPGYLRMIKTPCGKVLVGRRQLYV